MTSAYDLLEMVTRLSTFVSLHPWERCAATLIENTHPSSVYFFCKSASLCPSNNFYQGLRVSSQTILNVRTDEFPQFKKSDLVFLLVHEEPAIWTNETIQRYRFRGKNNFKLVIVANMNESHDRDLEYMRSLFHAMWKSGLVYPAVLLKNERSAPVVFTYIPFRASKSCEDTSPVRFGSCEKASKAVFDPVYKVLNLNNCPIRLSVSSDKPFTTPPLEGFLKPMVHEIAYRMNFSIQLITTVDNRTSTSCGALEGVGVRMDVFVGRAHMTVAQLTNRECSQLEYIGPPFMICSSWCTPILPGKANILDFLVGQFQAEVWIALVLATFIVTISVVVFSSLHKETLSTSTVFDVALLIFAQVPRLRFRSNLVRSVIVLWLCAALVIRTAYEGSSKSRSTAPIGSYIIRDLEQIAQRKLSLWAAQATIDLLDGSDQPLPQWFQGNIKPLVVTEFFDRMENATREHDTAFLINDLRCNAVSSLFSKESTLFYPNTGGCLRTPQLNVLLTLPGLPFNERLKDLLGRFSEAGLISKWLHIEPIRRSHGTSGSFTLAHLVPSLLCLVAGYCISCIAFVTEYTCNRLSRSRVRPTGWM